MRHAALCAVFILAIALHSEAQTALGPGMRAEALVKACELADAGPNASFGDSAKSFNVGYCLGYMWGVLVSHDFFVDATTLAGSRPIFCAATDKVSVGQAVKVFLKYAQDHPEELHIDASNLVVEALMKAFSCGPR